MGWRTLCDWDHSQLQSQRLSSAVVHHICDEAQRSRGASSRSHRTPDSSSSALSPMSSSCGSTLEPYTSRGTGESRREGHSNLTKTKEADVIYSAGDLVRSCNSASG